MTPISLQNDLLQRTLSTLRASQSAVGVVVLVPEAEKEQISALQKHCRDLGIPLAGAVFPALVLDGRFVTTGALLLEGPPRPSFLVPLSADPVASAEAIYAKVTEALVGFSIDTERPTLYLIFDGLIPNIASIMAELYLRLADRVSYAGGNAGSESFQPIPCLFDQEQLLQGGVLCILLPSARSALKHGYPAPGQVMLATATDGNRILQLDWRPAFEVYQEIIAASYKVSLTAENFYTYAVHFPFGILRANSDVVVRIPVALAEDGSVFCVGEVPENAMLVLLKAPEANAGDCMEAVNRELEAMNGPLDGQSMLVLYCAGRRMHLGEAAVDELKRLEGSTTAAKVAGALSLGEIGSTRGWGYPMFHNAALVCIPWGTA